MCKDTACKYTNDSIVCMTVEKYAKVCGSVPRFELNP